MTKGVPEVAPRSESIISTALDLFTEQNYEGTSMREIAAAVGVQPASLYNHYGSKEDILWEIVNRAWDELRRMQAEAADGLADTLEQFRAFVRTHTHFHAQEPQLAQIVNRQLNSLQKRRYRRVVALRDEYEHGLRHLLIRGAEEHLFHIVEARLTSFAILEVGMGVARWFQEGHGVTIGELCDVHEELALRMAGYSR